MVVSSRTRCGEPVVATVSDVPGAAGEDAAVRVAEVSAGVVVGVPVWVAMPAGLCCVHPVERISMTAMHAMMRKFLTDISTGKFVKK